MGITLRWQDRTNGVNEHLQNKCYQSAVSHNLLPLILTKPYNAGTDNTTFKVKKTEVNKDYKTSRKQGSNSDPGLMSSQNLGALQNTLLPSRR